MNMNKKRKKLVIALTIIGMLLPCFAATNVYAGMGPLSIINFEGLNNDSSYREYGGIFFSTDDWGKKISEITVSKGDIFSILLEGEDGTVSDLRFEADPNIVSYGETKIIKESYETKYEIEEVKFIGEVGTTSEFTYYWTDYSEYSNGTIHENSGDHQKTIKFTITGENETSTETPAEDPTETPSETPLSPDITYLATVGDVYTNVNDIQRAKIDEIVEKMANVTSESEHNAIWSEIIKNIIGKDITVNGVSNLLDVHLVDSVFPAEGLDVRFQATGIKKGDSVLVLHLKSDGTWEEVSATATADEEITAHFTSLSPVLYFSGVTAKTTVEPETEKNLSPKTGDTIPFISVLLLMAAVTGIIVTCKSGVTKKS